MNNSKFYRIAGWCALVVALLMLAIHVVPAGAAGIELIFTIAILLGLTFVFYVLYVAYRAESAGLSLAGLVLWILAFGLNLIGLVTNLVNPFLSNVGSLLWSLPFLIFGFLAYRSFKMPRGLAVVTLLTGTVYLILGAAGFMGSETFINWGNLVGDVFMLVWLVWLWRVFWSDKFATTRPLTTTV
jgi:hypothetical protein